MCRENTTSNREKQRQAGEPCQGALRRKILLAGQSFAACAAQALSAARRRCQSSAAAAAACPFLSGWLHAQALARTSHAHHNTPCPLQHATPLCSCPAPTQSKKDEIFYNMLVQELGYNPCIRRVLQGLPSIRICQALRI